MTQEGKISRRHALVGAVAAATTLASPPAFAGVDPLVKAIDEFEAHRKAADWKDGDLIGEELWNARWGELADAVESTVPLTMAGAVAGLAYAQRMLSDFQMDTGTSCVMTNCIAFLKQASGMEVT